MNRASDEEIRYVINALELGLKDNENYPDLKIHLKTCTIVEIELLKWILGDGECPYPASKEVVELSQMRASERATKRVV